jgi:hypothetical protein
MTFSSREDGEGMAGGGASERSDEVEELAAVCESSGGMVGVICGKSKSISPSERMRFLEELAAQRDEALVPDDISSDKISTSSSSSGSRSSSSELTSEGLDVREALSHPRGGVYGGKGVLRRWVWRGACGRDDSQSRIRCTKPSDASVMLW